MNTNTTSGNRHEAYKGFVHEYELAKLQGRWADSQAAASAAQQVAIHLTPETATSLRQEVLLDGYCPEQANTVIEGPRYEVVKDVVEHDCEHPKCGQLHKNMSKVLDAVDAAKRFRPGYLVRRDYETNPNSFHAVPEIQWLIIDTKTGERAFGGEMYPTRSEARRDLARFLQNSHKA